MSEPVTHLHHISLDHITDVTKVEEVLKEIYGEGNFEVTWSDAAVNVETDKEEPVDLGCEYAH
ncbi:hypothetical protein ACHAQD_005514 [Fusarium lateritium]